MDAGFSELFTQIKIHKSQIIRNVERLKRKMDKKAIGQKIKEIRLNRGMTLKEFGNLFDAAESIVLRWENGTSLPSRTRLKKLADLTGVLVSEFIGNHTGEKIKEIRLSLGMTLEEFGKMFGATKSNVRSWEIGRNIPTPERLLTIAKLGGLTVEQLLYENPLAKFSTDELIAELERRKP